MSSAAHEASHDASHAHASHAHDDFDPNPATELGPGEPRTPLWLSAVGLALFTLVALFWFARPSEGSATSTSAASPRPEGVAGNPALAAKPAAAPAGSAIKPRQLSPAEVEQLQKQIEAIKAAKAAGQPDAHGGH